MSLFIKQKLIEMVEAECEKAGASMIEQLSTQSTACLIHKSTFSYDFSV